MKIRNYIKNKMSNRKRITELVPFLTPIRTWQRKIFFYAKMNFDDNKYSYEQNYSPLSFKIFNTKSILINHNSGYDIKYQFNKAFNLELASKKFNGILIKPGETFSFWKIAKNADRIMPYKDGLTLINDEIKPLYGGGLCQLSNMLFLLFLHSPLTIIERRPHSVESLRPTDNTLIGIDSTIVEGWIDLKVKNITDITYQILISFDNDYMYSSILASDEPAKRYTVHNENIKFTKYDDGFYRYNEIFRDTYDSKSGNLISSDLLYANNCKINYELLEEEKELIFKKAI
jgi:vancomycin resistance protein VanW